MIALGKNFSGRGSDQPNPSEKTHYRRLWWYFVLLMSAVSLAPLAIMTAVSLHQYQKAFKAEMHAPVARLLSTTRQTLEDVISERLSALEFIILGNSLSALQAEGSLSRAYDDLQHSFGGFVDLGLIDDRGYQHVYVGPYDLKGKVYRDQIWFEQINEKDACVSEVYLGYRDFPHFIIAVKRLQPEGGFYVLRATLDMQVLNRQILSLDLGSASDAFLVNRSGILQTNSRFHGKLLERCALPLTDLASTREAVQEFDHNGESFLLGYAAIGNAPFFLVILQSQEDYMQNWIARRREPIWFLAGSSLLILMVVLGGTTYMVRQLREADVRRAKAFHNLEYTNKLASIGRLAASVAHEINNPLAIINEKAGLLKDMMERAPSDERREKIGGLADSILSNIERCSSITHRLLGFARRMSPHTELIDLDSLLREVVGFVAKEINLRNISVNFDVAPGLPHIESDRGQLQQVFLNIISNALAAIPDGGWIRLSLKDRSTDNLIETVICDNGPGIPTEDLKHVFEPFFSTKGEFGTGLGLSITQDIIHKLGGRISVESAPGQGTCFTVLLPKIKG